jgi:hypothetical protein
MESENVNQIPQVGTENGNPTSDSDRVQAPVVGEGPMDSGEGQFHFNLEENIAVRRSSLPRTPPNGGMENIKTKVGDDNPIIIDDEDENDPNSTLTEFPEVIYSARKKRKFNISPPAKIVLAGQDIQVCNIKKQMAKLQNMGDSLNLLVKQNVNTKVEIKKAIQSLSKIISNMGSTIADLDISTTNACMSPIIAKRKPTKGAATQTHTTAEETVAKPKMVDIGTQTMAWNQAETNEVTTIKNIDTYEKYCAVKNAPWKKELFSCTSVIRGSPLNAKEGATKVVVVDPKDPDMNQSIQRTYRERYPELKDLKEELEVLEQTSTVRSRGETIIYKRKLVKIKFDGTGKDLWQKIAKMKEENQREKEDLIFHHVEIMTNDELRKMLEIIFQGENIKIDIYTNRMERASRERSTYALMVNTKGTTYKEVLHKVKNLVKEKPECSAIKSIRSTREGNLLLTLERETTALKEIGKTLNKETIGSTVRILDGEGMESVFIRNMEETTTKEEIIEALSKEIRWREDYQISDLRPYKSGMTTATAIISKKDAEILLKIRTIRVGIVRCTVEKRIKLNRCFKCWSYEHKAADCVGPDRSKACHKCGNDDHIRKECPNEESCPLCGREGHQAATFQCPLYKKALRIERAKNRNRTTSTASSVVSTMSDPYYPNHL